MGRLPVWTVITALLDRDLEYPEEALLAAQHITTATEADVVEAGRQKERPIIALMMSRLPPGRPGLPVGKVVNEVYSRMMQWRIIGDATILREYLRRGGQALGRPNNSALRNAVQALRPRDGEEADGDVDWVEDRKLLRTIYETGSAGSIPQPTQLLIFDAGNLWPVVSHPEAWPATAPSLVLVARRGRIGLEAELTAVLPAALARYVLRAV